MLERRVSDVRSRVSELHNRTDQLRRDASLGSPPEQANIGACIRALDEAETGLAQIVDDLQSITLNYLDVFEASPTPFVVTTIDGAIIELNRAAAVLLKVIPSTAIGNRLQDTARHGAPADQAGAEPFNPGSIIVERAREVRLGGNLVAQVVRLPRRQKQEPRLLWSLRDEPATAPVKGGPAPELPVTATGSLTAESISLFRRAIEVCELGIILTEDARGDRVFINPAARRFLGSPQTKHGGLDAYDAATYFPKGSGHALSALLRERLLQGEMVVGETLVVRVKNSRSRWIRVSGTPVHGQDNEVAGAMLIVDDVTALQEEQQQRSQWLLMVVHDLRAPLAVISGYAQLAEKQIVGDASLEPRALQTIKLNAARLGRMIADLLDASRIEISQLSLQRAPVDLVALVKRVVEDIGQTVADRSVQVTNLDLVNCPVVADPERIAQVLENLLQNAVKYGTPQTPILVNIQCDSRLARVSVCNEGEEIRPEEAQSLFQRFHRSQAARQKKEGGLGLGLYIARGIVEAHDGTIQLESSAGQTTFTFTLPLEEPSRSGDGTGAVL